LLATSVLLHACMFGGGTKGTGRCYQAPAFLNTKAARSSPFAGRSCRLLLLHPWQHERPHLPAATAWWQPNPLPFAHLPGCADGHNRAQLQLRSRLPGCNNVCDCVCTCLHMKTCRSSQCCARTLAALPGHPRRHARSQPLHSTATTTPHCALVPQQSTAVPSPRCAVPRRATAARARPSLRRRRAAPQERLHPAARVPPSRASGAARHHRLASGTQQRHRRARQPGLLRHAAAPPPPPARSSPPPPGQSCRRRSWGSCRRPCDRAAAG